MGRRIPVFRMHWEAFGAVCGCMLVVCPDFELRDMGDVGFRIHTRCNRA